MNLKTQLDRFIHDSRTELVLVLLILLSVILLIIEVSLEHTAGAWAEVRESLKLAGDGVNGLFVLELVIRLYVASHKRRFFRNYWLDILSVLPAFPFFRLFRLLRVVRLLRAGILINRRLNAVSASLAAGLGAQLGVLMILAGVVLVGALGIYVAEGRSNPEVGSLGKAVWWSFFTLAAGQPIGELPLSDTGRLIAMVEVLGGITLFAVFTGVVSAFMVQRLRTGMEVRDVELDELNGHIVVCGWNRAGQRMLEALQADPDFRERAIAVVAEFSEPPEAELRRVDRRRVYFHKGDYTKMEVLEEVGIRRAAQAILLADKTLPRSDQDRDARTVLAALTIEKLNPGIFTCAQLLDRRNNVQLQVAGVEEVVVDDEVSGRLLATNIRTEGVTDFFSEILSINVGNDVLKTRLPAGWGNPTFGEAARRLKDQHDALLLGVKRQAGDRQELLLNPALSLPLAPGDELIFLARKRPKLE